MTIRYEPEELRTIYQLPFTTLLFRAQEVHRKHHNPELVQLSTLLSIKTGQCPENCSYCPQSAHHQTGLESEPLMPVARILSEAQQAKASGASRFCMGAAWREAPNDARFGVVLEAVQGVADLGLEVCCTLGMLTAHQAELLRVAGCDFYNHNLDSSPEYYAKIITTRTYDDRLRTLGYARAAGLKLCCGGIIGMGETLDDRIGLLWQLTQLNPPPESVPINAYVPVAGVPLAEQPPLDPLDLVRMIATTRIALPESVVRLSAGRATMNDETQALCFLAGANSLFLGECLLTTPNPAASEDLSLLQKLGLRPAPVLSAELQIG